jgi:hypothetical protein
MNDLYVTTIKQKSSTNNSVDRSYGGRRYKSNPFKDNELTLIRRRKLLQLYENEKDEQDYELTRVKGSDEIMEKYRKDQEGAGYTNERSKETGYNSSSVRQEEKTFVLPVIKTNHKLSPQLKTKIAGYDIVNNANFSLKKNEGYNNQPVDFQMVNKQLDQSLSKYNNQLEKLKIDDFLTRKKMQDELLKKINFKMEKIKLGLNEKTYFQDNLYKDWYRELKFHK